MATIACKPNKSIEIRYSDADGERKSLYVGKIAKRMAESIGAKIDHIVSRQILNAEPDRDVTEWLAALPMKLYAKLVAHGLAAPRISEEEPPAAPEKQSPTLKDWTDKYVKNHPGKPATIEQLEITARSLCKHFGTDRRIDAINAGDAEDFRKWLQSKGNEREEYKSGLAAETCGDALAAASSSSIPRLNMNSSCATRSQARPRQLEAIQSEWSQCLQNGLKPVFAKHPARTGGSSSHSLATLACGAMRLGCRSGKTLTSQTALCSFAATRHHRSDAALSSRNCSHT